LGSGNLSRNNGLKMVQILVAELMTMFGDRFGYYAVFGVHKFGFLVFLFTHGRFLAHHWKTIAS
jgi:hypothetical protein